MSERLETLVGVSAVSKMVISTFHSLCVRLLRQSTAYLLRFGLTSSFGIADETLQERAVNEAIQHINLDGLDENQKSVELFSA
jgi:DNA helicase-2/ATP-dependent DNA helicase PcrA